MYLAPALVALIASLSSCVGQTVVIGKPAGTEQGKPEVLSAQLALTGVELPFCDGVNDALPVTFSYPLADDPSPESFAVLVGDEMVEPTCATLDPANEDNEKMTVLLLGQFQGNGSAQPMKLEVRSVSFTVNDTRVPISRTSLSGDEFTVDLDAPDAAISITRSQTLATFAILDLSADDNTADDDENGCAALFPSSTYAIRLIFSSGVRDRDPQGVLRSLGYDNGAARARELFALMAADGSVSEDVIVGQADADGDNFVDVCVRGAGATRDAAVLMVKCEEGAAVISPDGIPCSTPIEVRLDEIASPPPRQMPGVPPPVEAGPSPPAVPLEGSAASGLVPQFTLLLPALMSLVMVPLML